MWWYQNNVVNVTFLQRLPQRAPICMIFLVAVDEFDTRVSLSLMSLMNLTQRWVWLSLCLSLTQGWVYLSAQTQMEVSNCETALSQLWCQVGRLGKYFSLACVAVREGSKNLFTESVRKGGGPPQFVKLSGGRNGKSSRSSRLSFKQCQILKVILLSEQVMLVRRSGG